MGIPHCRGCHRDNHGPPIRNQRVPTILSLGNRSGKGPQRKRNSYPESIEPRSHPRSNDIRSNWSLPTHSTILHRANRFHGGDDECSGLRPDLPLHRSLTTYLRLDGLLNHILLPPLHRHLRGSLIRNAHAHSRHPHHPKVQRPRHPPRTRAQTSRLLNRCANPSRRVVVVRMDDSASSKQYPLASLSGRARLNRIRRQRIRLRACGISGR